MGKGAVWVGAKGRGVVEWDLFERQMVGMNLK